ncbi:protein HEXIM1-like [Protobothrops mucrosquamatus]|uniref:protein HEXIM1-like n=1 Tax=Protobothrops mucrosquamatus TaxID=103944 RepID=UPI000775A592|nr:protein HEXIM1-like [Protobothrops mucrosquamatus]
MADAALSANLRQQRNGKTTFPPCRDAGGGDSGGGGPFVGSPPTNQELLQGREIADRWQSREVVKQDGRPVNTDVSFPGIDFTVPVIGESQSLGTPGINQIEDQTFGAAADIQDAGDEEQPDLQEQGYCGPVDQSCRSQSGEEEEKQLGKKKHRRRPSKKKKHWKPYYKLSWEEKKKFDEKQSQRASRMRAEMFAKGQPVAPYNTTQFLMEDHDQKEPDLKTSLYPKRSATKSDETSEEDFVEEKDGGSDGMGGDGTEFLQKDFSETYERYHVESLQNMSKQELIKEYLELEKCLSRMEDENNRLQMENKKFAGDSTEEDPRVSQLVQELDRLRAENQKLLKEKELGREQENNFSKLGE